VASWSAIARRIRVPLGFALAVLYFWLARPTWASMVGGGCIAVLGLFIRALASGHVTKNEQLTTTGPYAYTRNPLYLGSIVIAAGFALASRSWWVVALLVMMFVMIYLPVIRGEEKFLRAMFPQFEEYSRNVPRFFPRLTRFGEQTGSFSWDLYRKHREYNAVLGTAAMLAALAAKLIWWAK
jgi:protein-S-isoprenylcysteine O-methyltransferase Ste14